MERHITKLFGNQEFDAFVSLNLEKYQEYKEIINSLELEEIFEKFLCMSVKSKKGTSMIPWSVTKMAGM